MKILILFGTRPEAIKMAPVVKALQKDNNPWEAKVCVTAQHREMLDQVLDFFGIQPDFDLNLMQPGQNLFGLSSEILLNLKQVLDSYRPDYVLVHGDTTTTLMGALASFYAGAQIGHVEAGLRTYNKKAPFPEEINRQLTGRLADIHFAPTEKAKENLLHEGIAVEKILVTGNTVIDALYDALSLLRDYKDEEILSLEQKLDPGKKIILVTGHRRENFGKGFEQIANSLKTLALNHPGIQIVYPVHLNPNVRKPIFSILGNISNILLIEPLKYPAFVWLMNRSFMIITDSGGIQEEAPALGKPVLVMRETTERPEAVEAGTVELVGTDPEKIIAKTEEILRQGALYEQMKKAHNPYGDGNASERIRKYFLDKVYINHS